MVTENVGKAAVGFVDALKAQPLLLVLAVTNFATLGFVYFQASTFTAQRQDNVKLFVSIQAETQKLLSQCIIPAPGDRPQRSMLFKQ
jgi:hypothetical protein